MLKNIALVAIAIYLACTFLGGCSPIGENQIETVQNLVYKNNDKEQTLEDWLDESFDDTEWSKQTSPINGMDYVKFTGTNKNDGKKWEIYFFALTTSMSDNRFVQIIENKLDINQVLLSGRVEDIAIDGELASGDKFGEAIQHAKQVQRKDINI